MSEPKMAIDLTNTADGARWVTGQLVDGHNTRDSNEIPWNGSAGDDRGFARLDTVTMENGSSKSALRTHPKWVPDGTIKGFFPWVTAPDNAVFTAQIGFLDGASASDGAEFWVFEHHRENGTHVWNPVLRRQKGYTGELLDVKADLTHLSGEDVFLELRVDAAGRSTQDWAAWVDPKIESQLQTGTPMQTGTMPVTLELSRVDCRDSDEEDRFLAPDGDEPYVLALALFVDGRSIDVVEAYLNNNYDAAGARLRGGGRHGTHGNLGQGNVHGGDSFPVPDETGTFRDRMSPVIPAIASGAQTDADPKSVARAALIVVLLEQDNTSTQAVEAGYRKLRTELKSEIEKKVREIAEQVAENSSNDEIEFTEQDGNDIADNIKGKVTDTVKKRTLDRFDLFGIANPDDFIGTEFEVWTFDDIQQNEPQSFRMEFRSDTAHYVLNGNVRTE